MADLEAFRRACYEAAGRTGGELTEFRSGDVPTPNFHQGIIAYADRVVAIVGIRDAPLLAIAVPRIIEFIPSRDSGPLTFVDFPDLAEALDDVAGFRLLTATELNGPIDDVAEWPWINQRDLRYWKPRTLGQCLFNYWD